MLTFACKSQKSVQKQKGEDVYRVIVSFISKGEGPDLTTFNSFESFLTSFQKKVDKTITYDRFPWGREGEADYCFYLKDLKKSEQKDFVDGLLNLTKSSSLVQIKENVACAHKKSKM